MALEQTADTGAGKAKAAGAANGPGADDSDTDTAAHESSGDGGGAPGSGGDAGDVEKGEHVLGPRLPECGLIRRSTRKRIASFLQSLG